MLGLTHHALAAGNAKSLQDAREFGDYVIRTFGKDPKPEEVCTAGLPEAFLLLYKATGDERYLKFAAEVRHGNSKAEVQCASLLDWKQTFDSGAAHVYVMLARCYAQTELYRQKKMPSLLEMSEYMRHELLRTGGGLNVVGSASDGEWFSYTQNGAGLIGESCVTAYLLRWLESLMRLEGDLRYGDIMERTIYNALLAAQDPEGRRIRYFTPFTGPRVYFDQDGFCCPGNFRRILAELPQKVYYLCADKTVAVNLFTTSQATVELKFSDGQIEKNLAGAVRDLSIANKTDILDVKFNYAYSALIKGGIALLSHSQLKVKSIPGHQVKIIEKLAQALNDDSIESLGNMMRQKRNLDFYSGGVEVTEKECEEYIDFAESVLKRVQRLIIETDHDP